MTGCAYLGLGSNLGDKENNLCQAIAHLKKYGTVNAVSTVFYSEPVGYKEQPWFYNLVCRMFTDLSPFMLLAKIQEIEKQMGRKKEFTNGPRIIDIDILFYDNWIFISNRLIIPHPRLAERAFVLRPLSELAPDLYHPLLDTTIGELWAARKDKLEKIELLKPQPRLG